MRWWFWTWNRVQIENSNICTCIGAANDAKRLRKHTFSTAIAMWHTRYHGFIFYHYFIINAVSFKNLLVNLSNYLFQYRSMWLCLCVCVCASTAQATTGHSQCVAHSLAISLSFSSLAIIFFHRFGTFSHSPFKSIFECIHEIIFFGILRYVRMAV